MKNEWGKKLDDLFKKRLENPENEAGYREGDWDALEDMLDKRKKRGVIYLLPIISSVAALILVVVGFWLYKPKKEQVGDKSQSQITKVIVPKVVNPAVVKDQPKENNDTKNEVIAQQPIVTPAAKIAKNSPFKAKVITVPTRQDSTLNNSQVIAVVPVVKPVIKNKETVLPKSVVMVNNTPQIQAPKFNAPVVASNWTNKSPLVNLNGTNNNNAGATGTRPGGAVSLNTTPPALRNDNTVAAVSTPHPDVSLPVNANVVPQQQSATLIAAKPATAAEKSNAAMMKLLENTSQPNTNKLSAKTQASLRSRFSGTILGAQDINGAGSFKQSKVGSKAGLVFAAGVSQKLTISTGAVYSSTPYAANYDNFSLPYQPKVPPVSMSANCQMLDIPINIGYKVYNKGKNTVSFGTGLSSYIMLQQDYSFNYAASSGIPTRDYSVPNSSSYLFKIVNLNATYERQISSKAGISVQPYLKLPLAAVGYSQVKLQTTGIAVGLSWSLDSSTHY